MSLPAAIRTVRWMVRDTFRQSVATKLFWVMFGVTAVCTAVCASVRVTGDSPPPDDPDALPLVLPKAEADKLGDRALALDGVRAISGEVSLGFGAATVPLGRSREDAVRLIQIWMAAIVADTAGVFLVLLWTAGFLPTFLEPQAVTVLLAKPAPRWAVLLGKYLGVVLFVTVQAALFVGLTWLALGLATGVWVGSYWLAVPLLAINFAVFYSVSAFLAVWTRSTVASGFGVLLFWVLCWGLNFAHHQHQTLPTGTLGGSSQTLLNAGYWALPKPLDMGGIFFDAMRAEGFAVKVQELRLLQEAGRFHPELSVLASLAFAAVTLALAGYEFKETDY